MQDAFGKGFSHRDAQSGGFRAFDDPLALAERHVRKWQRPDGMCSTVFFHGQMYRYDEQRGWLETNISALRPWVRETVQGAFDEHANKRAEQKGESQKTMAVSGHKVTNTYQAIESLSKRAIPRDAQAPFWLEPFEDWRADDLLILDNGVLNVASFTENLPQFFIPPTAKLFYQFQSNFAFDAKAVNTPEWDRFLDSLEQDEDWKRCLQEIFGYCLWPGYDLQKYFVLFGPPRSGKGTIVGVLENLIGGPSAVCSPGIEDFATDFGLEQAIGKRLAVVPEVSQQPRRCAEAVSRLKAITGGDMVTVNRKHMKNIPIRLNTKIVMQTNNFVALPDNSGALVARMIPLKLTKSFVGVEDKELSRKLGSEHPGILNWALEGLKRLRQANGEFTLPRSTRDELAQIRDESAPLQAFVADCCHLDLSKCVQVRALHEIYCEWHKATRPDEPPMAVAQFGAELKSAAHTVDKKRASTVNKQMCNGATIVATDFDQAAARPYLYIGICPKRERCIRDAHSLQTAI